MRELEQICAEAARQGGAVLRDRWNRRRTIEYKGKIDLVTDADKASEALVVDFLRTRFPGSAILAEESGQSGPGSSELAWYVDPLDGTTNYAHGVPHFSVNVAAEDAEGLAVAATYDPMRDELFLSARGKGATLNGAPIGVSSCDSLERALLVTGFAYDIHESHDAPFRLFAEMTIRACGVRRFGSAALDLAYVAAGRFDGFWEAKLKPWDIAAGILHVREAGGMVADFRGGGAMLERGDICAAAPALQPVLLGVIAGTSKSPSPPAAP